MPFNDETGLPNINNANAFRDTYQEYLNNGFSVVPCAGKAVYIDKWTRYCANRATKEQCKKWLIEKSNHTNIGICFGSYKNLLCFDYDFVAKSDADKPIQEELMAVWQSELDNPHNLAAFGAKGFCIFYRYAPHKLIVDKRIASYYDLMVDGSQKVLPPSIHPLTGMAYKWLSRRTLLNTSYIEIPIFPLEKLKQTDHIIAKYDKIKGKTRGDTDAKGGRSLTDIEKKQLSFLEKKSKDWKKDIWAFCKTNKISVCSESAKNIRVKCVNPSAHANNDENSSAAINQSGSYRCFACSLKFSIYNDKKASKYFNQSAYKKPLLTSDDKEMAYRRSAADNKLGWPVITKANCSGKEVERGIWKQLQPLLKGKIGELELVAEIIKAGFSIMAVAELLSREEYKNCDKKTQISDFINYWESARRPIISSTNVTKNEGDKRALISKLKGDDTYSSVIAAPCGWGKSTNLKQIYCGDLFRNSIPKSHLILSDQVSAVLGYKYALDFQANEQEKLIDKSPNIHQMGEFFEKHTNNFNSKEPTLQEINARGIVRKEVRASFSFHKDVCLMKPIPSPIKANCCGAKSCEFNQCGAHNLNKQKREESLILVSTFASYALNAKPLEKFQGNDREVILIDEKPEVYKTLTLELSNLGETLDLLEELNLVSLKRDITEKIKKKINDLKRINESGAVQFSLKECSMLSLEDFQEISNSFFGGFSGKLEMKIKDKHAERIKNLKLLTAKEVVYRLDTINDKFQVKISKGYNHWKEYNREGIKTIILDATATFDPEYTLPGALPITLVESPEQFKNLTFICFSKSEISKTAIKRKPEAKKEEVRKILQANLGQNILIIGSQKIIVDCYKESEFGPTTQFNHFWNLRGKNNYNNCSILVLLNMPRLSDLEDITRAIDYFNPKEVLSSHWTYNMNRNGKDGIFAGTGYNMGFANPHLESLRVQFIVSDLIQTIMRINIRSDNEAQATVYIPTSDPAIIGRLLQYFKGAKVQKMEGV